MNIKSIFQGCLSVCLLLSAAPSYPAEFSAGTTKHLLKLSQKYCFVSVSNKIPEWSSVSSVVSFCPSDQVFVLSVPRQSEVCRRALRPTNPDSSPTESLAFQKPTNNKYGLQLEKKIQENTDTSPLMVLVSAYPAVNPKDLQWLKRDLSAENVAHNVWKVKLSKAKVEHLAKQNWVEHVQISPERVADHNQNARRVVRSEQAQLGGIGPTATMSPPSYLLSGLGLENKRDIRIALFESGGVHRSHREFDDDKFYACECPQFFGNRRGCVFDTCAAEGIGSDDHATMSASILAGDGYFGSCPLGSACGDADYSLRGHAPEARIGEFGRTVAGYERLHSAFVENQSDLSVHPYFLEGGGYLAGQYDKLVAGIDLAIRGGPYFFLKDLPRRPQVRTSGNFSLFEAVSNVSKNAIVVGALPEVDDNGVLRNTNMGPTPDGRVKPDLLAKGFDVQVAAETGDDHYSLEKGESSAAGPVVAGVMALMIDAQLSLDATRPKNFAYPATYKSVLVNTATDLVGSVAGVNYGRGPDFATGYGLINAEAATQMAASGRNWRESSISSETKLRTHTYCISVDEQRPPSTIPDELKVTLAWDDPAACAVSNASKGRVLVNDLDIELESPSGQLTLPQTAAAIHAVGYSGAGNATSTSPDRLNNVEQVSVLNPESGVWQVRVKGSHVPLPWQTYGLASSKPLRRCGEWLVDTAPPSSKLVLGPKPVLIEDICRYVDQCSLCAGEPGGYCPNMKLQLLDVPSDAVAVLVRSDGTEVARRKHRFWRFRSARTFRFNTVGDDASGNLHLRLLGRDNQPYPYEISPSLRIR